MEFVYDRIENILGKGENAGYPQFFFFQQCFQKEFSFWLLKFRIVKKQVYLSHEPFVACKFFQNGQI